jgi:hypothetical protein
MHKVGDILYIMITAVPGTWKTRVVEGGTPERPRLQVLKKGDEPDSTWPILKPGDYIVWSNQEQQAERFEQGK